MAHIRAAVDGKEGFSLALKLGQDETATLQRHVRDQYLAQIRSVAPDAAPWFEERPIDEYHLGSDRLEHGTIWSKSSRIFSAETVRSVRSLPFMQRLADGFGAFEISGESGYQNEEIYWRLVRPGRREDVGPIHADCWFWELGNGETPEGAQRVKIWIAICTEPGRNGLQVLPSSHNGDWRWHREMRDGIMKPVFDEDPAKIRLELPEFVPGQAVVFNDRLLHAGAVNGGQKTRVSMEFTMFTYPGRRLH